MIELAGCQDFVKAGPGKPNDIGDVVFRDVTTTHDVAYEGPPLLVGLALFEKVMNNFSHLRDEVYAVCAGRVLDTVLGGRGRSLFGAVNR